MKRNLYILCDDPTCFGGIQQFVRNLADMLSAKANVKLLAYYGGLSNLKECPGEIIRLNFAEKRSWFMKIFLGGEATYFKPCFRRTLALLWDSFQIRRNLKKILSGGDILIVNAFYAAHLFVPEDVLKNNTFCFIQHNAPKQMYKWRYDFGGFLRKQKIALFNKFADAMVFLSPFEMEQFTEYLNLQGKKTAVIRHQTFLPSLTTDLQKSFKDVMFLGRLDNCHKRIDRILQIAAITPDFTFNIYGDGPDESYLKSMAKNLKNVHFHGYVKNQSEVIKHNAIMIITSDYEGYPIAGIECVAHGLPIVCLNSFPASADLVENGKNGILINDFSPEKFSEALRDIAGNYEHYRRGAIIAREKYDPDFIRKLWEDFIDFI